jgi:hypothetical protein
MTTMDTTDSDRMLGQLSLECDPSYVDTLDTNASYLFGPQAVIHLPHFSNRSLNMAVEDEGISVELNWLQAREIAIQQAIDSRDLAGLRAWSKEVGGFGSSAIRKKAWYV